MKHQPATSGPALTLCPDPSSAEPRRNYIFIDYENVHESDLSRADHDQIILVVVVGEKQKHLPLPFTEFLQQHPGQLRLVKTLCRGKNALDFILTYEIGQVLAADPRAYIHIISKDKGFDALIAHLKANQHLAARHNSLSQVPLLLRTDERYALLVQRLKDPAAHRPIKRSSLINTIQQYFQKSLTPETVEKTIRLLIKEKILAISDTGKVSYP